DPINVSGNENFTFVNGISEGSGTEGDPYIIENWLIRAENSHGIWIENTDQDFIIRNCSVYDGSGASKIGVKFEGVTDGKIENCFVESNYDGIRLNESSGNILINNTVKNSENSGICLDNSDKNIVDNCTSKGNGLSDGIVLRNGANNNLIDGCTISNNSDFGVGIIFGADSNIFRGCLIENNDRGLYISSSRFNRIFNNNFENNGYGSFISGDNNRIFHNNFLSNDNQAYDIGSNSWSKDYPKGGNYWRDYSGKDENRGENQNIWGHDGMGDIPYGISGDNNQDRYPLVRLWESGRLMRHSPILIDGNDNFAPANGVINPNASGTENDPYIIENLSIDASSTRGLWIRYTDAHFIVRNCLIENGSSDSDGIYLKDLKNGRIENCTLRSNLNGIHLYYSSKTRISGNSCSGSDSHGVYLYQSDNNFIDNNSLVNENIYGIYLDRSSKNVISQNSSFNNKAHGIYLNRSDNNSIENNISENNSFYGIALYVDSDNNSLVSNSCYANKIGIRIRNSSDNNTLIGNKCLNNIYGVRIVSSLDVTMKNQAISNSQYNFGVAGSKVSHFVHDIDETNLIEGRPIRYLVDNEGGSIDNSLRVGYLALVRCENIRIEDLTLERNDQGILLASSQNIVIQNCELENNNFGLYAFSSDNNHIYHSNFINNENQVYVDGSNSWDNGYPSGGNYWSDYTGVDENKGKNQNISGGDGIGDEPYEVSGESSLDRYPFMEAWPPTSDVQVLIYPSEDNAPPGMELAYEVSVINTGSSFDSFALNISDNQGWDLSLDDSLFENVAPGENRTTVLRVAIPENENLGVEDNIVVTATSQENEQVSDTSTCIALSTGFVRRVVISISPAWEDLVPGDTVQFGVTVCNEGNVPDNYSLSTFDDGGWILSLADNLFVGISAGESSNTTLSVTAPDNDNITGIEDNITVTVSSLENENVSDSTGCVAYVGGEQIVELDLSSDWNLVGLPVVNENTTKESLFENSGVDPLLVTMLELEGGSLTPVGLTESLSDNVGYYVKPPSAVTVSTSGIPKDSDNLRLVADWNLIGLPVVDDNTTKGSLFEGSGVDPLLVTMLKLESGSLTPVGLTEPLENDKGYYVKPPSPVTINCP
ncbi:hypothetical protein AKJ54_00870, partial [candidate division MSBL1 archaeon SCGC-AAA382K21]